MSAFDKVIGYRSAKEELSQILDMFKHSEIYKEIGAKLPHGVLLYGAPGMGKTLLATSFIEEAAVKAFSVKGTKGKGAILKDIADAFEKAKQEGKAIIFFDDMDKFSSSQSRDVDDPAFVAIQSGIDSVKGKDILVVATVNNVEKLPSSLKRNGRFDCKLHIGTPGRSDAAKIVEYYLRKRKVDPNANYDDIAKMINYSSCADLDKVVNKGAIIAVYKRKNCVQTEDIVEAYLGDAYDLDDWEEKSLEERRSTSLHEAGHCVVSEIIKKGSVGLVSVRTRDGFTKRCLALTRRPQQVLISLAGKVACELYDKGRVASGCYYDLRTATELIREGLTNSGTNGTTLLYPGDSSVHSLSDAYKDRVIGAVNTELERYLFLCRDILIKNKGFLFAVRDELVEKGTLLHSDIQRIRASFEVTPCECSEKDGDPSTDKGEPERSEKGLAGPCDYDDEDSDWAGDYDI